MKHSILILALIILFTGCSQDDNTKQSSNVVQIDKEVKKTVHNGNALVCLDESDKITCKLMTKRLTREREVEFEWRSPNGKDDRNRELVLPVNHASVYDMRTKKGRAKGMWSVEVEIDDTKVSTTFMIE